VNWLIILSLEERVCTAGARQKLNMSENTAPEKKIGWSEFSLRAYDSSYSAISGLKYRKWD